MRFLAIDPGDKRTGLAVGDDETRNVFPLDVLDVPAAANNGQDLLRALQRAVREHAPHALVLGLPLNMDGSEGPRAKLARALADRLHHATALPVHLQDERLTSAAADWELAGSGLTRGQKKQRRDALAAAALLRDFLNQQPPA